ncbi:unnamed protein product [Phytophthora lilii]|uniref:Unnamed protein product n=1 Tax=Phytophthora lilii TaxID=2077276 RepID=A0A9W6X868_9STRA|nr:unnamed protein product [Phytophthora lilii]
MGFTDHEQQADDATLLEAGQARHDNIRKQGKCSKGQALSTCSRRRRKASATISLPSSSRPQLHPRSCQARTCRDNHRLLTRTHGYIGDVLGRPVADAISANHMAGATPPSSRMGSYGSIPQVDGADAKPDPEQQQRAMSLAERLYAYDLTWSTKLYQRFGRDPTPRLCWEIFSHSGDGFLYVALVSWASLNAKLNGDG